MAAFYRGLIYTLEFHNRTVNMSMRVSTVTWHVKNQESLNFYGKRQSTDVNTEITKLLELPDRAAGIQKLQ